MDKHRHNGEVSKREYVGGFSPFLLGNQKHSLEVTLKPQGKVCLTIHWGNPNGAQEMHSIELLNEQRANLAKYLLGHTGELWQDLLIDGKPVKPGELPSIVF